MPLSIVDINNLSPYHEAMKRHAIPILLIAVISIFLYANTLQNGFVYDDDFTVVNNTFIKQLNNLPKLINPNEYFSLSGEVTYRPVVTITYFLDYALYGLKPWGFHLTNLLLHVLNAVLLYIFLTLHLKPRSLDLRNNQPLVISLLFAAHPVLTEAVNAVSFREDPLCFFFYISTLMLYLILRSRRYSLSKVILYALSCLTYFLALLSKEMASTLPLIVLCYELFYRDRGTKMLSLLFNPYLAGYITVTLIYIFLRFGYFYNPTEVFPAPMLTERLLTIPWLTLNFIKRSIVPVMLSAVYDDVRPVLSPFSASFIWPFTIVLLLLLLSSRVRKDIAFGILFFIITLLPVLNLIPVINPLAERYLYMPMAGFAIVLGFFIGRIEKLLTPRGYCVLFVFLLCTLSIMTIRRNTFWKDDYSLWTDTVKKAPGSVRAHNNLGFAYYAKKQFHQAINEYKIAIKLNPNNESAHNHLGNAYCYIGNASEGIKKYQEAIRLKPSYAEAHNNLGMAYLDQGLLDEAIIEFKEALKFNPDLAYPYFNLGLVYKEKGLKGDAKRAFENALRLTPDDADVRQALEALN